MTKRLLLCLLLACGSAQAQTYKCVDARGKVTYTSTLCEDAGQTGGEVKDRLNSAPAQRVAPPVAPSRDTASKPDSRPDPEAKAPVVPPAAKTERRCFSTKTGTRCNDDVPENDPVPTDERTRGETKAQ
jgi:hypothetical protein